MDFIERGFNCSRQCRVYLRLPKNSQETPLCGVCTPQLNEAFVGSKYAESAQKKVRFLQAYSPGPLSPLFRGDVTFVGCDLVPVFAHRFIMAGKSTVFGKMFDIDMKEKEIGTVQVDDADAPVLRSMVNFCYTAEILFTEEASVEEVMKLAHKYDISELKEVCESELCEGINEENLCTRLRLAHIYDIKTLNAVGVKFFKDNFDDVYPSVVERLR
ncbi:hypothetical protein MPTK1_8g07410 [Marchantia polymorpha subsp. ruderalis]|uniref:BTB domain-containing protein n=1 Tax=Marchantia polymorpha TaxID=3197 RepID=A0A2R6XI89_MARPO|nr:hypothetical protein MARPO_0013s0052 [Marchantia polymorpha]BBN19026.1 hypothetical protein Mp_8g07410 [Marchantia polymorpha subsp. ruderalis]|eukprot:PTQ45820.1 hypothetical protein MARPO_0013s0052 [Marchantia polymorpha]